MVESALLAVTLTRAVHKGQVTRAAGGEKAAFNRGCQCLRMRGANEASGGDCRTGINPRDGLIGAA